MQGVVGFLIALAIAILATRAACWLFAEYRARAKDDLAVLAATKLL
jgi:hypothetical protein